MNIGLIIIGRIESSRLKEKMLLPLGEETFIEQVFNFAKKNYDKGPIIFATTDQKKDALLTNLAEAKGIPSLQGHSTDILKRYQQAAQKFNLDAIITWDGDDLFVDQECIEKTYNLLQKEYDFVRPANLPFGSFSYGISVSSLNKIVSIKDDNDTEGWGRYFTQIPGFKIADYTIPKYHAIKDIRLTLDYEEDYILIKKIFDFQIKNKIKSSLKVINRFSKKFPKDCLINEKRIDEYAKRFKRKYSEIKIKKV